MLKLMRRVIAFIRTTMGGATPTQPAGHALQEPTTQTGKATTASATKPRKSSPVPTQRKQKKEAVQPTTVAVKRGRKKSTAQTVVTARPSKATGSKSKTPARKTRQHAK